MPLSEFESARVRRAVEVFLEKRRPPPHIRRELDLGYRIIGQSVELFEVRPAFMGPPGETMERAFAKATFVRTRGEWKVFWKRADLKWHGYEPAATVKSVEEFCLLVDQDAYCCFFG